MDTYTFEKRNLTPFIEEEEDVDPLSPSKTETSAHASQTSSLLPTSNGHKKRNSLSFKPTMNAVRSLSIYALNNVFGSGQHPGVSPGVSPTSSTFSFNSSPPDSPEHNEFQIAHKNHDQQYRMVPSGPPHYHPYYSAYPNYPPMVTFQDFPQRYQNIRRRLSSTAFVQMVNKHVYSPPKLVMLFFIVLLGSSIGFMISALPSIMHDSFHPTRMPILRSEFDDYALYGGTGVYDYLDTRRNGRIAKPLGRGVRVGVERFYPPAPQYERAAPAYVQPEETFEVENEIGDDDELGANDPAEMEADYDYEGIAGSRGQEEVRFDSSPRQAGGRQIMSEKQRQLRLSGSSKNQAFRKEPGHRAVPDAAQAPRQGWGVKKAMPWRGGGY